MLTSISCDLSRACFRTWFICSALPVEADTARATVRRMLTKLFIVLKCKGILYKVAFIAYDK